MSVDAVAVGRRTASGGAARIWPVVRYLAIAMRPMMGGYWVIILVGFAVSGVVIHRVNGVTDRSAWDLATQSPKYVCAAAGFVITQNFLTVMVAHGVTRRALAVAGSVFLALNAAATAGLWTVAYLGERAVFAWQDWPQTLTNMHLFSRPTQVHLVFVEFVLLILAHEVSGWLIGTSIYRFGIWAGIALLPLTLVPAVGSELLLLTQWVGSAFETTGWGRLPLAISTSGVLVVSGVGLWANYLLLRPIGLKPPRT